MRRDVNQDSRCDRHGQPRIGCGASGQRDERRDGVFTAPPRLMKCLGCQLSEKMLCLSRRVESLGQTSTCVRVEKGKIRYFAVKPQQRVTRHRVYACKLLGFSGLERSLWIRRVLARTPKGKFDPRRTLAEAARCRAAGGGSGAAVGWSPGSLQRPDVPVLIMPRSLMSLLRERCRYGAWAYLRPGSPNRNLTRTCAQAVGWPGSTREGTFSVSVGVSIGPGRHRHRRQQRPAGCAICKELAAGDRMLRRDVGP